MTSDLIPFIVSQVFLCGAIYGGFRAGISSLCRRVTRVEDKQDKSEEREIRRGSKGVFN